MSVSTKSFSVKPKLVVKLVFKKKSPQSLQNQKILFKSILGEKCVIEGRIDISGHYLIAGRVLGDIVEDENSSAILWIDKSGYVEGNVICSNLVLIGVLKGNAVASNAVEVCSGATIIGDIQSERLHVDSNAKINGRLSCLYSSEPDGAAGIFSSSTGLES